MTICLHKEGYAVNPKRVRRLMGKMGLQAVQPKRRTTVASADHKVYPYLLRNLPIIRPNQVCSADITYIPMLRGSMYLVAVMDWPKVSLCVGLAALEHPGWALLLGCARSGTGTGTA